MPTIKMNLHWYRFRMLIITIGLVTMTACSSSGGDDDNGGGGGGDTYTVTGTITAGSGDFADSDVNDPIAPYQSNDTISVAQAIPNPATIGGYLNRPGTGDTGRSQSAGDTSDFFAVSLLAGQSINLTLADSVNGDIDMFLYDGSCTDNCDVACNFQAVLGNGLIAKSIGIEELETISVPSDGNYFIDICIARGATNYTLAIGQKGSNATALNPADNFIPGDIIVKFKEASMSAQQAANVSLQARATSLGLKPLAGAQGRAMLMSLGDSHQQSTARATLGLTNKHSKKRSAFAAQGTDAQLKWDTIEAIKALRKRADVLYAEPNYIHQTMAIPNDEYYAYQWHYPLINLPAAWDVTTGSSNVIVSVIDTGVLLNHPDFSGQLVAGYDFISVIDIANDGDGIDNNPDDPGDSTGGRPSSFHGSHVAGTIAAATNNTTGIAGIAWASKIMPLRALGKGGGTSYDINQSILFSAGLANDSGSTPPQKADIINMSLGGGGFSQAGQDVITQARNAGVIIIAAAGNENTATLSYPASYTGVVSVSAVGYDKSRSSYSNFGTAIDVAAPGGETSVDLNADGYADGVLSAAGDDSSGTIQFNYPFYQGTSMASPHMAGVVALMKAQKPDLTADELDNLLVSGEITEDLGDPGRDNIFGHGLIDAYKAVTKVQTGVTLPPKLNVSPSTINLGSSKTTEILTVTNAGDGDLSSVSASSNQSWLVVSPTQVDAGGLGNYTITADRSNLANGTHKADITFTSSANTETVTVFLQVGTASIENSSGYLYVLLLDADGANAGQANVGISKGRYTFSITDVKAGTYTLVAGSDIDNDGFICDQGESCGAYTTLDSATPITISSDVSSLNFNVQHQVTIRAKSATFSSKSSKKNTQSKQSYKQVH